MLHKVFLCNLINFIPVNHRKDEFNRMSILKKKKNFDHLT